MTRLLRSAAASVLASCLAAGAALAEPLVDAAQAGEGQQALSLIADGADVNAASPDGTTALHWAVHHGDAELVERLIRRGADVAAVNHYGQTPMAEAAVLGDAAIIDLLLAAGADPESANQDGQTALTVLARTNNVEAARLLIDAGADVNAADSWRGQTPLMQAAAERRADMVKLLLDSGAEPNARSLLNEHYGRQITAESRYIWRTPSGWTALLLASREGCIECVQHLLDAGADINMGNPENVSPLLIAALNMRFDTVKLLIERGADPDKWDWRGRTPLFALVDVKSIPHGGRPDIPTTDRTTAFEAARMVLEAGANPNIQTKLNPDYRNTKDDRGSDGNIQASGVTALAFAAKVFDAESIRLIGQYGALVDLPTDRGLTPLMIAAGMGSASRDTRGDYASADTQERSIAALQALLDMGADINATAQNGQTALFSAAQWGWTDVVEFLVVNGAKLDHRDNNGQSALDLALGRGEVAVRSVAIPRPETAARIQELMQEQGLEVPEATDIAQAQ